MKHLRFPYKSLFMTTFFILLVVFFVSSNAYSNNEDPPSGRVPDMFTVRYSDGSFQTREVDDNLPLDQLGMLAIAATPFEILDMAMADALAEPDIIYVEPVYYLNIESFEPDDVKEYDRWRFDTTGLTSIWQQIFDRYVAGNSGIDVIVAIIDEGVTTTHPDLNVIAGYDFGDNDNDPNPIGSHGNHVAGIVGAIGNNSTATTGVYPGVKLMPLKVFSDDGVGTTETLALAIRYAADNGAHIINMSLGYPHYVSTVEEALIYAHNKGVLIVAATGNDSNHWLDSSIFNEVTGESKNAVPLAYPAYHNNVFSAGSVQFRNNQLALSDVSNISSESVFIDVVAPGSSIISTSNHESLTEELSGTSMAAPHVAGLMALMRAQYPSIDSSAIYDAIKLTASTAMTLPVYDSISAPQLMGAGLIQIDEALKYYLADDLTLKGKKATVPIDIPFTFDPLINTYTVTLDDSFYQVQLQIAGNDRIDSVLVQDTVAHDGISDWLSFEGTILETTFKTQSISGHEELYTIKFIRPAESDNAELANIGFSDSPLVLDANNLISKAPINMEETSITVNPEALTAQVSIDGVIGKTKAVTLNTGENIVEIAITSPDESITKTYTLTIIRDVEFAVDVLELKFFDDDNIIIGTPIERSSNDFVENSLHYIYPLTAEKVQIFYDQGDYILPYNFSVDSPELISNPSGAHTIYLNGMRNTVNLSFIIDDTQLDYTLTLDSEAATDLRLSSLKLSSGTLTPAFNSEIFNYTASVANGTSQVTITSSLVDPRTQVHIGGLLGTTQTVPLNVGENIITLITRANDTDYPEALESSATTLTITRADAPPPPPPPPPSPPAPSSGGFVPPPAPAPAPAPAPTPLMPVEETVIIEEDDGTISSRTTPSEKRIQTALAEENVIIDIKAPTQTVDQQVLRLNASALKLIVAANKGITLAFNALRVDLPVSLLKSANDELIFIYSTNNTERLQPTDASLTYTFKLTRDGNDVNQFTDAITLELRLIPSRVRDVEKLAVFYLDPKLNIWTYAGGQVAGSDRITFSATHFSNYQVKNFDFTFNDIKDHWAKRTVEIMASRRITSGVSSTEFAPDASVTNAQFIALLTRMLALPERTSSLPYSDLDPDAWYIPEVRKAEAHGLLTGAYSGILRPDEPIERQVMAKLLINAYGIRSGIDTETLLLKEVIFFNDEGMIDREFNRAVRLAFELGFIQGTPEGNYFPKQGATRAEAMTVLYRSFK